MPGSRSRDERGDQGPLTIQQDLTGKRALVTGGNRGIGLEVVRLLSGLGLEVFLGSRDPVAGAATVASLGLPGIAPVRIDVADPDSVAAARDALAPQGVDVLINNAAINPRGRVTAERSTWRGKRTRWGPGASRRRSSPRCANEAGGAS